MNESNAALEARVTALEQSNYSLSASLAAVLSELEVLKSAGITGNGNAGGDTATPD